MKAENILGLDLKNINTAILFIVFPSVNDLHNRHCKIS